MDGQFALLSRLDMNCCSVCSLHKKQPRATLCIGIYRYLCVQTQTKQIMTRRSIRKYSTRDVDDALLNSLLAEAEHTQTMGNLQLYSVVVNEAKTRTSTFQSAHGDAGSCCAHILCRL